MYRNAMKIAKFKILFPLCLLWASSATAQEYVYPNKLISDQGLIEYRRYTLKEAQAYEQGGFDPDLPPFLTDWGPERMIVPDSNRIYCVDLAASNDSLYCAYATIASPRVGFARSTDDGGSWSGPDDLSDTAQVWFNHFPDVVAQGTDLAMGFRGYEPGRGENLFYRISADAGGTWEPMLRVFPYWADDATRFASLANYGRTLYFAYFSSIRDSLYVIRSTDWGTSWDGAGKNVAYLMGTPQPMRIGASGNFVHLVWVNETRPISVRYSRSTDWGLTWSPEIDVSHDSSGAQFPYISVDGQHVVVSWMGYKYSPYMFTGDLFVKQSFDNGTTWDSAQVLTDLHYVGDGMVHAKDSLLVAGWEDFRFEGNNDEVMTKISIDHGATWGLEARLSFGEGHSYPPASVSTGQIIHTLWGDVRPETPGLYYCRNDLLTGVIGNNGGNVLPEEAVIFCYPNPFNIATTITSEGMQKAAITIYDITGRRVATLHAEHGRAVWAAKGVSSGVYFARVAGENKASNIIKLIYIK